MIKNKFTFKDKTIISESPVEVRQLKEKSGHTVYSLVYNDVELITSYCKPDNLNDDIAESMHFLYNEYFLANDSDLNSSGIKLKEHLVSLGLKVAN